MALAVFFMLLIYFCILSFIKAEVCLTFALRLITPQSFNTKTSYQQGEF